MGIRHPSTIAKSLLHKPAVSHSEKGTMDPNESISYRSGLFPISKQNISNSRKLIDCRSEVENVGDHASVTEVLVFGWD